MTRDTSQSKPWLLAGGLLLLLVAVALGAFMIGRNVQPVAGPAATPAPRHDHVGEAESVAGEMVYYCSMHPDVRSTNPNDTCPICGMNLIPMPTEIGGNDDADLPVLRLSERSASLLNIRTMPVERRAAEVEVRFVGKLEYDERRLKDVVVRSESYVEKLHANYLWMPVREGEILAELYSPPVNAAARELLVIQQSQSAGRNSSNLEAVKAKLDRLGVPADHVQAMVQSGQVPRTYALRSPMDGVVAELDVRDGESLGEGQRLVRVADLSTLWLQLEAYETDVQWLRLGQRVRFTAEAYPGDVFEGELTFIDPRIDAQSRTARVRVDVPNPDGLLKPGMFARGVVTGQAIGSGRGVGAAGDDSAQVRPPLLVPASALLMTGRRAVVYVRLPDAERPVFEGRQVVLGPRVGDYYVVREGLTEGERVVTHGAFSIDSELQIRGRPSMMSRGELFGEPPQRHAQHDGTHGQSRVPAEYPLDVCLVSNQLLGSMGAPISHEHEGGQVFFCCDGCRPQFDAEPQKYLPKLEQASKDRPLPAPVHNH